MTVLGISTNTRLFSVAIISQNQLIKHSTYLYKSSWSPAKRDEIVASLEPCVRQYCIKSVALSIPYVYHQTHAFRELVEALKNYFVAHHITVTTYTPEAFATYCKTSKKRCKKALMYLMTQRFPILTRCYQKELRNKNKYYFKLFEAVAAAVLHDEGIQ